MPHTQYQTEHTSEDIWNCVMTGTLILFPFFPLVIVLTIGQVLIDFRLPSVRSLRYFSFLAQAAMYLAGNGLAEQIQSYNDISQDSCMEHSAQESCHVACDLSHLCTHRCNTLFSPWLVAGGPRILEEQQSSPESGELEERASFVTPFWQYQHRSVAGHIVTINCSKELLPRHSESGTESWNTSFSPLTTLINMYTIMGATHRKKINTMWFLIIKKKVTMWLAMSRSRFLMAQQALLSAILNLFVLVQDCNIPKRHHLTYFANTINCPITDICQSLRQLEFKKRTFLNFFTFPTVSPMTSNISQIHGLDRWLKCHSLSRPMFSMWSIKARNFSVFISCFAKNKESGNTSGMINRWIPIYHVFVYEAMKISIAFRCVHFSCDVQFAWSFTASSIIFLHAFSIHINIILMSVVVNGWVTSIFVFMMLMMVLSVFS